MSQFNVRRRGLVSVGAWVILAIALASSAVVLLRSTPTTSGLTLWTSARDHVVLYRPALDSWNAQASLPARPNLFSADALSRRMMSGFLSKTPVADLIEVERSLIGPVFAGPLEDVGFVDLTDRLRREGLMEQFNAPSFSPWTSRGRIFGLPHDVHPVLLAYRHDLVEAAGIDLSRVETWDDFARAMLPLTKKLGPDGRPVCYPLNLWYTSIDQIEALMLQAGGELIDDHGRPAMNSAINARVIATIVSWTGGPNRIAADAPEFSASGNRMRLDGYVASAITPDWLCGVWKHDVPGLSGKLRLMPLPAWERGGRRTSVWGGTMLGLPKDAKQFEAAWRLAKHLYLDPQIAQKLYETNGIISPVQTMWSQPFYASPDGFFGGQAPGSLYVSQAPNVPTRTSSPYNSLAKARLQDAVVGLRRFAEAQDAFDADRLTGEARRLLADADAAVGRQMEHNAFLNGEVQ